MGGNGFSFRSSGTGVFSDRLILGQTPERNQFQPCEYLGEERSRRAGQVSAKALRQQHAGSV